MKITYENYQSLPLKTNELGLIKALLDDLKIGNRSYFPRIVEMHYQDWHNDYSTERTDPCPDFYGTFFIKWEGINENINSELDLPSLDDNMCTLHQAFNQLKEEFD